MEAGVRLFEREDGEYDCAYFLFLDDDIDFALDEPAAAEGMPAEVAATMRAAVAGGSSLVESYFLYLLRKYQPVLLLAPFGFMNGVRFSSDSVRRCVFSQLYALRSPLSALRSPHSARCSASRTRVLPASMDPDGSTMDAPAGDEESQVHATLMEVPNRQPDPVVQPASPSFRLLYTLHAATLLLILLLFGMLFLRTPLTLEHAGVVAEPETASIVAASDPVQSTAVSLSSTGAAASPLLPVRLPSPPASFGRFLMVTNFGRESNRYMLMLHAVRWSLLTDRRVVLAPYDQRHSTPLNMMYDIHEMDQQMRYVRVMLGRPALQMDQAMAHIISWKEYQQMALGLSAADIEARTPTPAPPDYRHPGHCFALERLVCTKDCLTSVGDECVEGFCPLNTRALTNADRVQLPSTLSALRALTDADPLLVMTGHAVWYTPLWSMLNASEAGQRVSTQQRAAMEALGPSLHPIIMQRAQLILEAIRANCNRTAYSNHSGQATGSPDPSSSSVPVLLLHLRLGDFGHRASDLPVRLANMAAAAASLGLTNLNLTSTRTCIVIATDSTVEAEKALMRRAFPTALIGLPDSQRESDRVALEFASRRRLSPYESRVLFPITPPVFNVLLDKAVCILADYFIGTTGSTFSAVIQSLRTSSGRKRTTQATVG